MLLWTLAPTQGFTIIASKRVDPSGKVVVVEADPSVLNILNKNIKLNELTNVTPVDNIAYSKEMELGLAEYNKMFPDVDGKYGFKDKTKVVLSIHQMICCDKMK